MNVTLRYFGRPRERLGLSQETVQLDSAASLGGLLEWLRARGGDWASELTENRVRCAINQEFASLDAAISDGDEIALFSPISGG